MLRTLVGKGRLQNAVEGGLKAMLQAPVDAAAAAARPKTLPDLLEKKERSSNKTFLIRLEKQLFYGSGVRLADLMPERRCGALQATETREWKRIPDVVTGVPRKRSIIFDSATGKRHIEAPTLVEKETGRRYAPAWHVASDCGSVGRPGVVWFLLKAGGSGTLRWDRPHRHISDLEAGGNAARLTLTKLEWRSVLRLRVQPFGKGALQLRLPSIT